MGVFPQQPYCMFLCSLLSMPWLILLVFISHCLAAEYREPQEAFSELWLDNTDPGEVDQLGDLTVFRYGPATNDRWLVWGHDIFGPESGRTKEYCQKMNTDLGVTCILPDFFRGAGTEGQFPDPVPVWEGELSVDWEELLVPYLVAGGAEAVGVVGTCFGSYIVMHLSASGQEFIRGGVSLHPSHPQLMEMAREDEAAVYFMIDTPQFFMDTPDSSDNVREGGLASTIIETTYFDEFEDPCSHGFFNRGDLSDPAVKECVDRAMG